MLCMGTKLISRGFKRNKKSQGGIVIMLYPSLVLETMMRSI